MVNLPCSRARFRLTSLAITALLVFAAGLPAAAQTADPIRPAGAGRSERGDRVIFPVNPLRDPAVPQQAEPSHHAGEVVPTQFQELELEPQLPPASEELSAEPLPDGQRPADSAPPIPPLPESATFGDDAFVFPDGSYGGVYYDQLPIDNLPELYSTNDIFRRGFWYSQQDIVVLLRTEGQDVIFGSDQTVTPGQNFIIERATLGSKTVDFTYEEGTRLTIGHFLGQDVNNRDHTLEFTFLRLFDYQDEAELASVSPGEIDTAIGNNNDFIFGSGVTGPPTPGFSNASLQRLFYASDMNSFELNYRFWDRPARDRLALQPNGQWIRHSTPSRLKSVLFGARGVSINELFRYLSEGPDPTISRGNYQVQTENDMVGVQVGIELAENYAYWSWGLRSRFGVLMNFADRRSKLGFVTQGVEFLQTESLDRENLAGLIEVGLFATYQFRPNLLGRVGYDVIYITGIATAPENMKIGPTFPNFEVTGDALFHGASLGVEMLW